MDPGEPNSRPTWFGKKTVGAHPEPTSSSSSAPQLQRERSWYSRKRKICCGLLEEIANGTARLAGWSQSWYAEVIFRSKFPWQFNGMCGGVSDPLLGTSHLLTHCFSWDFLPARELRAARCEFFSALPSVVFAPRAILRR